MKLDVVAVVEGRGEVEAVPVLLRRIAAVASPGLHLRVETIRRDRQAVVRSPDFENAIELAAQRIAPDGLILVLLDADRVRDAKGWLSARTESNKRYRPPKDQVSLTASFDMAAARSAPSFDKLWRDLTSEFDRVHKAAG